MSILMYELPRRHRITVEHFYRMAEAGLFDEDERVELIEGEVIDVPPMGHRHAGVLDYLAKRLMSSCGAAAVVRAQLPVRLGDDSEPLPDIVVAKPRDSLYLDAHPTAADLLAVIEISSSTLDFDRNVKVPLYARNGVPETWILDVGELKIHRYRNPQSGQYAETATLPLTARLTLRALDCEIDLQPLAARLSSVSGPADG